MGFKNSFIPKMTEHFSTRNIFHEQIEISAVLGNSLKVNDKWMVNIVEDFTLIDNVISLLGLDDFSLFHDLDTRAFL